MTLDLIVPTIPGREESLERCLASFERHATVLNEIVIQNSSTCGEGWMEGLKRAKADHIAFVADDLECIGPDWLDVCIETVNLGMLPCPRVYTPQGTIESQGGDMNAYGHLIARPTKDLREVDFTTVPFCSREQIEAIGMIPTQYCCDVWVSYRGRQLGYETVLRHGYDLIHHQHPVGRGAGMGQNERDAMDCAAMFDKLGALDG